MIVLAKYPRDFQVLTSAEENVAKDTDAMS